MHVQEQKLAANSDRGVKVDVVLLGKLTLSMWHIADARGSASVS